jgi:hypothetical protein
MLTSVANFCRLGINGSSACNQSLAQVTQKLRDLSAPGGRYLYEGEGGGITIRWCRRSVLLAGCVPIDGVLVVATAPLDTNQQGGRKASVGLGMVEASTAIDALACSLGRSPHLPPTEIDESQNGTWNGLL